MLRRAAALAMCAGCLRAVRWSLALEAGGGAQGDGDLLQGVRVDAAGHEVAGPVLAGCGDAVQPDHVGRGRGDRDGDQDDGAGAGGAGGRV